MQVIFNPEYRDVFRLKRRVITKVKRLVRPLLVVDGENAEFLFDRPLVLRNMSQAWLEENTDSNFKIRGFHRDAVLISASHDPEMWDRVPLDRVPIEDLIRLENMIQRRRQAAYDAPFKVPKIVPIRKTCGVIDSGSIITDVPAGIDNKRITMFGLWRGAGFFWFKREDVRLCGKHAAPFQPLQPALKNRGSSRVSDVPAHCPWCKGGELDGYWAKYPKTNQRLAIMTELNRLLPADPKKRCA